MKVKQTARLGMYTLHKVKRPHFARKYFSPSLPLTLRIVGRVLRVGKSVYVYRVSKDGKSARSYSGLNDTVDAHHLVSQLHTKASKNTRTLPDISKSTITVGAIACYTN